MFCRILQGIECYLLNFKSHQTKTMKMYSIQAQLESASFSKKSRACIIFEVQSCRDVYVEKRFFKWIHMTRYPISLEIRNLMYTEQ